MFSLATLNTRWQKRVACRAVSFAHVQVSVSECAVYVPVYMPVYMPVYVPVYVPIYVPIYVPWYTPVYTPAYRTKQCIP
jgi:hypothetical protein